MSIHRCSQLRTVCAEQSTRFQYGMENFQLRMFQNFQNSRVAHFSTNHERWVAQVWIFRPGKLQTPDLEKTRPRWLRVIVPHISKSRWGPPIVICQTWATRQLQCYSRLIAPTWSPPATGPGPALLAD